MRHALTVRAPGAPVTRCVLSRPTQGGGSGADALLLPGAAPGAVRLVPVIAGVVVEASAAGIRVAGHAVPPGSRRLLRPGERADVQAVELALEGAIPADDATRAIARALLREAADGAAPVAGPRLTVLTGPSAGERHALVADETLGRGRAATVRLPDPHASRVHARLRPGPDGVTVEDLRSKNGVVLNGARLLRRRARLAPGDELGVGDTLLVLEDPAPPRPAAAAGPGQAPRRRPTPHLAAAALLALAALALALAAS